MQAWSNKVARQVPKNLEQTYLVEGLWEEGQEVRAGNEGRDAGKAAGEAGRGIHEDHVGDEAGVPKADGGPAREAAEERHRSA